MCPVPPHKQQLMSTNTSNIHCCQFTLRSNCLQYKKSPQNSNNNLPPSLFVSSSVRYHKIFISSPQESCVQWEVLCIYQDVCLYMTFCLSISVVLCKHHATPQSNGVHYFLVGGCTIRIFTVTVNNDNFTALIQFKRQKTTFKVSQTHMHQF